MDDAPCVQPEDSVWQHLSGGASWSVSCNVIKVPFSALYRALIAFCFGARYRRLAILSAWKLSWLGTTFCTKNERYLEALAVVGQPEPVRQALDPISRRIVHQGRPYRGLRPLTPEETDLFRAVLRGEFLIQGFRNPDLRRRLFPEATDDARRRRQASGRVTRLLRLLRAHGLIRKVSATRYYRVTGKGQHVMSIALQLREIDLANL